MIAFLKLWCVKVVYITMFCLRRQMRAEVVAVFRYVTFTIVRVAVTAVLTIHFIAMMMSVNLLARHGQEDISAIFCARFAAVVIDIHTATRHCNHRRNA